VSMKKGQTTVVLTFERKRLSSMRRAR
jgi:hypothetical protein